MVKDDFYYLEQTPVGLAKDLIAELPLEEGDKLFEPFRGEGAFYNSFPDGFAKDYAEIEEGRDYATTALSFGRADWVITNPPFRIRDAKGKEANAFFPLLEHFSKITNKGIAFLSNDRCFSALTPVRLKRIHESGWYIQKIVVCAVKKWRGRYFWIVFGRNPSTLFKQLDSNY